MDVETLYKNLCDMGFDALIVQEAIGQGNFTMESALDWLTKRSKAPLTFEQRPSAVLRLGPPGVSSSESHATGATSFVPPGATSSGAHSEMNIGASGTQDSEPSSEPHMASRYRGREDVLRIQQMEASKAANQARQDKARRARDREIALKEIKADREVQRLRNLVPAAPAPQESKPTEVKPATKVSGLVRIQIRDDLPGGKGTCHNGQFPPETSLSALVHWFYERTSTSSMAQADKFTSGEWRLLSGLPLRRVFTGPAELQCSLSELGLAPNAKLFAQVTPPAEVVQFVPELPVVSEVSAAASVEPMEVESKPTHLEVQRDDQTRIKIGIPNQEDFLRLFPVSATLGDVMAAVTNERGLSPDSVHVIQRFPLVQFSTELHFTQSLRELGLTPSANLHLRMGSIEPLNGPQEAQVIWPEHPGQLGHQEGQNPADLLAQHLNDPLMQDIIGGAEFVPEQNGPIPFHGVGHQLIPQAADMAPTYHRHTATNLAGRAALDRFGRHVPAAEPSSSCPTTFGAVIPSLVELCSQKVLYGLAQCHRDVMYGVRHLPSVLATSLIDRLARDFQFTPKMAKLFANTLSELNLAYRPLVTNELLRTLSLYWRRLTALVLDGTDAVFTDNGLWELKGLTQLRRLSLRGCSKITDYGFQVVAYLPFLEALSLRHTHVTDVGLDHLSASLERAGQEGGCIKLLYLDLAGLSITSGSLHHLTVFPNLQCLDLSSTKVSDPFTLPLLPHLIRLIVSHCLDLHMTQDTLYSLSKLPSLKDLRMKGLNIKSANDVLTALEGKPMTRLDGILEFGQMNIDTLSKFSGFPITLLDLESFPWLDDACLSVIGRIASIQQLAITHCQKITRTGLVELGQLSRLTRLTLVGLNIPSAILLEVLPRRSLSYLSVSGLDESDQTRLRDLLPPQCAVHFITHARLLHHQ